MSEGISTPMENSTPSPSAAPLVCARATEATRNATSPTEHQAAHRYEKISVFFRLDDRSVRGAAAHFGQT